MLSRAYNIDNMFLFEILAYIWFKQPKKKYV